MENLRTLLEIGGDPNPIGIAGRMPVMEAIVLGDIHCIKLLLQYNADPLIYAPLQKSNAEHMAIANGNEAILALIAAHRDKHSRSALQYIRPARASAKEVVPSVWTSWTVWTYSALQEFTPSTESA